MQKNVALVLLLWEETDDLEVVTYTREGFGW